MSCLVSSPDLKIHPCTRTIGSRAIWRDPRLGWGAEDDWRGTELDSGADDVPCCEWERRGREVMLPLGVMVGADLDDAA
jgi:hypothetical protein